MAEKHIEWHGSSTLDLLASMGPFFCLRPRMNPLY